MPGSSIVYTKIAEKCCNNSLPLIFSKCTYQIKNSKPKTKSSTEMPSSETKNTQHAYELIINIIP